MGLLLNRYQNIYKLCFILIHILLIINEFHDRHLVLVEEINMLLDICQNELSKNNSFL